MVLQHGARQLTVNCANTRPLGAAQSFFSAFYRWSQAGCYAYKNVHRAIHNGNTSECSDAAEPVSIANMKATRYHSRKASHEILSQDIRHIMRSLPHSVAVLTTSTREKNERIDQIIRETFDVGKTSLLPQKTKTSSRLSHRPLLAIASGNSASQLNAKEGVVSEDRSMRSRGSVVSKEVNIQETSTAFPPAVPGLIPKERQSVRGFITGRKNYYGISEGEWSLNLESSIRSLEVNSHEDYRAMTLSSFTTVCLSDPPMISFNIRGPSKTLDALRKASGRFMIHLLEANSAGAKIASAFSRGGGGTEGFDRLQVEEYHDYMAKNTRKTIALPVIMGPGVKKVLYCQIGKGISTSFNPKNTHAFDIIPVGDHHVVFARVITVLHGPWGGVVEPEGGEGKKWHGLSYADGQYRDVGGVIEFEHEPKLGEVKVEEPKMEEP